MGGAQAWPGSSQGSWQPGNRQNNSRGDITERSTKWKKHQDSEQPGRLPGGAITREGGAGASERNWEALPGCQISTLWDIAEDGDILSKPSSQTWRPSTLRGTLSASLVEFPAPSPAFLQASKPGRCTVPTADLASFVLLDYLPTSQVGPPGKTQAHQPFLICPTLPFPCHLPAVPRSPGF